MGETISRIFTPPGTGGREAQQLIAQGEAQQAAQNALAAQKAQMAAPPIMPKGPDAPPQFSPGSTPAAKQRAAITATTMLGAAAASGQTARKTLLGQ